jgi:hypothetical protein
MNNIQQFPDPNGADPFHRGGALVGAGAHSARVMATSC